MYREQGKLPDRGNGATTGAMARRGTWAAGMASMLKNTLLATAMALSVYALSTNAEARHRPTEWYVVLEGGANLVDDADVLVLPIAPKIEAEFETGWSVFLGLGYRWENNWRVELEAGFRHNDVDCVTIGIKACADGTWGDISQATQMINVLHDIPLSDDTTLSVGLGIGADYIMADSPFSQDNDWVLAGQALFELSHRITDRLELVATYRFLTSDDPQFRLPELQQARFENENHTFTLGLRFDLEPDEKPLASLPSVENYGFTDEPAKPEQFVVFFGFNKSVLDASALSVVAEAATTAIQGGSASILVTGYTDTSGSAAYNEQLSLRRANTVRQALVDNGVAAKAISTTGKGEAVLLVQTRDQEQEPRNRRATIDIDHNGNVQTSLAPPASVPEPVAETPPPATTTPTTPQTSVAPTTPTATPSPAARVASARRSGVDEETLAQYRVWIAQARAKHRYPDSEQRMLKVMMCESGGRAAIVNPVGPYSGLFQYSNGTWHGAWNDYRGEGILDAKAQIFATALAWEKGMQRHWGCYSKPH